MVIIEVSEQFGSGNVLITALLLPVVTDNDGASVAELIVASTATLGVSNIIYSFSEMVLLLLELVLGIIKTSEMSFTLILPSLPLSLLPVVPVTESVLVDVTAGDDLELGEDGTELVFDIVLARRSNCC